MIAVILDSNSLYGDPFFNSGNLKRLIAYSSLNKIEILVSELVIEETVNNTINKIKTTLEKVKGQIKTINDVSGSQSISLSALNISSSESELRKRFVELASKGAITRVPYKNELMPELIHRAVKKIMPFKDNKEEFRDAVIWLSVVEMLKLKDFEKAFLITNNSSDFVDPKTGALHQDLAKDYPNIKLYRNLTDFFSGESEEVGKLISYETSSELLSWISENKPDELRVGDILRELYFDDLQEKVSQALSSLSVHDLEEEVFDGYVQPYDLVDFDVIDCAVDIDLDAVIVTGKCTTSNYVEIYQYNPVYDNSDEKFSYVGQVEVEVILDFMFFIAPDRDPYGFDVTGVKAKIID